MATLYQEKSLFKNVTSTHLPLGLDGKTMDAGVGDLDQDGDLDLVLAVEFGQNIILMNDGKGKFTKAIKNLPQVAHDSEDIGIGDFDQDGDLDIVFVSEDDKDNELYFNNGDGTFIDVSNKFPTTGTSNAVVIEDINNDSCLDILIGNTGPNIIMINNGKGGFIDETQSRLPVTNNGRTQDIELADVDLDGDLDLIVANEGQNKVYINDGTGIFNDETDIRMPKIMDESREVVVADIDRDGDLDIFFANVQFLMKVGARNRLLINDGSGVFTEMIRSNIPNNTGSNFTAKFVDLDIDGYPDIITGSSIISGEGHGSFFIHRNDGAGRFSSSFDVDVFPVPLSGNVFDIEVADFNGDGQDDLYIANRATKNSVGGQDFLLFRQ
jgi:hypothetical protein